MIERVPLVSVAVKGRARAVLQAASFATLPRPDVIWTGAREVVTPYLWAQLGRLRRPLVLDLDWTLEQQEALAPVYFGRAAKRGRRLGIALLLEHALWRSVSLFTPWSHWTADSLRRQGIPDDRIAVLPPGVDLERWQPRPELRPSDDGPLRLLFVGGDFERKGGDMLLEVFQQRFSGRCELDVVTRDAVAPLPGVRVHRAEPNSALLRELYARADLFVLPTRAECFGIATLEAMACGLPVIVGDVGGVRDIVDPEETGWLIEPTGDALTRAIEQALADRMKLRGMGHAARRVVEERFDGRRNDGLLVEILVEQAARQRQGRR
ncbi:MAG: glycosyltransferase family 4 protein [Chloroflexota bacterium]|nr:glycosyltransferase family 4 protein [Chloroflexota bacterium]